VTLTTHYFYFHHVTLPITNECSLNELLGNDILAILVLSSLEVKKMVSTSSLILKTTCQVDIAYVTSEPRHQKSVVQDPWMVLKFHTILQGNVV
jgi:hypothetical protein